MTKFNLFDPEICCNQVFETDEINHKEVKRKMSKEKTSVEIPPEGMNPNWIPYATQNFAHVFSKQLKLEELKTILDEPERENPEDPFSPEKGGFV